MDRGVVDDALLGVTADRDRVPRLGGRLDLIVEMIERSEIARCSSRSLRVASSARKQFGRDLENLSQSGLIGMQLKTVV
jgi:hypothetical protein